MVAGSPAHNKSLEGLRIARPINGCTAADAAIDIEDTLAFSVLENVRPTIEAAPRRATEAYARIMKNQARFGMVLTTGG